MLRGKLGSYEEQFCSQQITCSPCEISVHYKKVKVVFQIENQIRGSKWKSEKININSCFLLLLFFSIFSQLTLNNCWFHFWMSLKIFFLLELGPVYHIFCPQTSGRLSLKNSIFQFLKSTFESFKKSFFFSINKPLALISRKILVGLMFGKNYSRNKNLFQKIL